MILFVQEGCRFCDKLKSAESIVVATVKHTASGLKAFVDGHEMPAPLEFPGFPALVDGSDVYIGLTLVEDRLKLVGALK
jgi:hypothetical protein